MEHTVLGDRIRAFRQRRGWSQNELASRAGVKQPTLQRIEASKRQDPGFSIVARLSRALGISLDLLADPPTGESFDAGAERGHPAASTNELEARIQRLEALLTSSGLAGSEALTGNLRSVKG